MTVHGFFRPLLETQEYINIARGLQKKLGLQSVFGLTSSQISYLTAALTGTWGDSILFLAASTQSAKKKAVDLKTLMPGREVTLFPDVDPVPFGAIAQSREVMTQRLRAIEKIMNTQGVVVVAPIGAILKKLVPPAVFIENRFNLEVGLRIDLQDISLRLVNQGYERVEMVEGPGHFSIRGGIIDIFSPVYELPVRIELFDDEVDSIRAFDPTTQRSLDKLKDFSVFPAREIVFPRDRVEAAIPQIKSEFITEKALLLKAGKQEAYKRLSERVGEFIEQLEEGAISDTLDNFFAFCYPDGATLFEYLHPNTLIFLEEPARQKDYVVNRLHDETETHVNLLEQGLALPSQIKNYVEYEELNKKYNKFTKVGFSLLPKQFDVKAKNVANFTVKTMHLFKGKTELLIEEVKTLRESGYCVVLFASTSTRISKIKDLLTENNIFPVQTKGLPENVEPGKIIITEGLLEAGFELNALKMAVITDWEIYGQPKKPRTVRSQENKGAKIRHFSDLRPGDFIVHANHGIGKYIGIKQLEVGGVRKDYLLVQYAGEDKLYVPTDQISMVQKYLGAEGTVPKLYKLGGTEWHRVKQKVKESVKDMANDLIALYAARQKVPGIKFSADTVWQKEFEEAFPYEETPDQLHAIEEIKEDMESPRPMDRLLCGDVGYGKTEVALRAAFKAVMDNKQIAVLVPTTILAQQHFNTFKERFAGYPVEIDMLSRFKSPKEQREILRKVANGGIDVIIGTHRLVQEDTKFKDLGLVIIDEEQRFGVVHKEKLKRFKQNVDVLTLSATPIPRTLNMAMIGARDMSILEAPPEDRFPVQTYVLEFNLEIVADAIRREIDRGGQVYYVHNRVNDIDKTARLLQSAVPEAKFAVAHGQMKEEQLERHMVDFIEGAYDVLVCTTIIETGLDIPNVNTLIVDEAEKMGLSQLHQLRGRVGRSHRLAYAYFTYMKDKSLTEVAEKRLQAIREFTEFGAGFKIAMRDLEIRGAGNILGPEQHGHLLAVGYDMYCKLLDEAVQEIQGNPVETFPEPTLDLNVDAFIGDAYISDAGTKIEVYKKIMHVQTRADSEDIEEELVDRFGDIPESVYNLIAIARIKYIAAVVGVQSINQQKDTLTVTLLKETNIRAEQLAPLTAKFKSRISFAVTPSLQVHINTKGYTSKDILTKLELMLNELTAGNIKVE